MCVTSALVELVWSRCFERRERRTETHISLSTVEWDESGEGARIQKRYTAPADRRLDICVNRSKVRNHLPPGGESPYKTPFAMYYVVQL